MEQVLLEEGQGQAEVWAEGVAEVGWVVIVRAQGQVGIVSAQAAAQKYHTR